MLLLIDNYDSFTYNIVHAFQILNQKVVVVRNHCSLSDIIAYSPTSIVIGPGPGNPQAAGISKQAILKFQGIVPVLGICLGHQAICEVYGGKVIYAQEVMHGKLSQISHHNQGIFKEIPQGFLATRYHSLVADINTFPSDLEITAKSEKGEIMGLRHKHFAIEGVQFHPESVASEYGLNLLNNFLMIG